MNNIFNIDNINEFLDTEISKITKSNEEKIKNILVLSGGGIKGICHIGALKALQDLKKIDNIKTISGTSIGALVGFLFSIGYSPDDLFNFILLFDFKKLKPNPINVFEKYGIDNGDKFIVIMNQMLKTKNIDDKINFKQLYQKTGINLIINASCINDKQVYYFSHKTHPDMSVVLAVRMSIAVPIYFAPVIYDNKMFVDGGCIDNYPIQLFSDNLEHVIGIHLAGVKNNVTSIKNPEEFIINLVQCLQEGVSKNSIKGFEKQTINIITPGLNLLDLSIDNKKKQELYDCGYNTTVRTITNSAI
jgi:NTE family protein